MAGDAYALVVDDHPLVARGMAEYLVTHCGFGATETAASAGECASVIQRRGGPALVVVDYWLPGGTALPLLRQLSQRHPHCRLLAVSGDDTPGMAQRVADAGAHGFLHKHEPAEVFAQAVATLRDGRRWFPRTASPAAPAAPDLPVNAHDLGLTERQGQVLAMMLRGLPNKRIAQALNLSEPTVKEHVSGVLARLGVGNRVEAIMLLRGRRLAP